MRKISTESGYEIHYGGGRLADVMVDGHAVECVQVREYDYATGEFGADPSDYSIRLNVERFLDMAGGLSQYV